MWWAQTTHPKNPIAKIAYTIPSLPKISFLPQINITLCLITPKAGKIRAYTSGCPKNQNKCWNKTGSPPPLASKKEVFRFRSNNSIVIPPAKTGRERTNRRPVTTIVQTKRVILSNLTSAPRLFHIVLIKFNLLKILLAPAMWRLKITKSTLLPLWPNLLLKGGYTVQPVPAPESAIALLRANTTEGGSNQNLKLLRRGNDISGQESIKGNIQLPNPPIATGITKKKIMKMAWAVTTTLKIWSLPRNDPTTPISRRIKNDILAPTNPLQTPRIIYNLPMFLWLVL